LAVARVHVPAPVLVKAPVPSESAPETTPFPAPVSVNARLVEVTAVAAPRVNVPESEPIADAAWRLIVLL